MCVCVRACVCVCLYVYMQKTDDSYSKIMFLLCYRVFIAFNPTAVRLKLIGMHREKT